jgi:chemotaxis protein MotA
MNASVIGLLLAMICMTQAVLVYVTDLRVFNDIPGIVMIIGSTFAVALTSYKGKEVKHAVSLLFGALKAHHDHAPDVVSEMIALVRDTDSDPKKLEGAMSGIKDPFLLEGVGLLVDRFEIQHVDTILKDRTKKLKEDRAHQTQSVKTLAKYPPAFGIMACVLGLISVMQKLGGDLGPGELAPSMAVALVGTLIGLITANYFIMPMGEKIAICAEHEVHTRKIIHQGVLMMAYRESPLVVQEKLNSFLSEDQRVDVLGIGSASKMKKAA